MSDHYLWDGSGEPDPEVQRLERLLSEFRSHRPAPELPAGSLRTPSRLRWSAIAAAVALMAAGTWLTSRGAPEGWQVARAGAGPSRLAVGQTLETGAGGHATMNVGSIGIVEVEANSRLSLERARGNQQRMSLEHGLIHAFIWAPPRTFVVDTPSAVATDLGCFYTLEVDKDGGGLVSVLAGWVSFAHAGRESFIPAGAACRTRVPVTDPAHPIASNPRPPSAKRSRISISPTVAIGRWPSCWRKRAGTTLLRSGICWRAAIWRRSRVFTTRWPHWPRRRQA